MVQKEWATIDDLVALRRAPTPPAKWEPIALAQLSAYHCLRISEAHTVHMENGLLVFMGTKSGEDLQRQEVGPWA